MGGSRECDFPCFKSVKHLHLCCKCCLKLFSRTIPRPLFNADDLRNYKIHSHEKQFFENPQRSITLIILLEKQKSCPYSALLSLQQYANTITLLS